MLVSVMLVSFVKGNVFHYDGSNILSIKPLDFFFFSPPEVQLQQTQNMQMVDFYETLHAIIFWNAGYNRDKDNEQNPAQNQDASLNRGLPLAVLSL